MSISGSGLGRRSGPRVHSFPSVAKPVPSDYESQQRTGTHPGRAAGGRVGRRACGRTDGRALARARARAPVRLPRLQNDTPRASACAARPWAQPLKICVGYGSCRVTIKQASSHGCEPCLGKQWHLSSASDAGATRPTRPSRVRRARVALVDEPTMPFELHVRRRQRSWRKRCMFCYHMRLVTQLFWEARAIPPFELNRRRQQ